MREYGRHIQKMVEYLLTIEDRPARQRQAQVVIELMGFLNPHLKNVEDFRHMDVDSPYPIPKRETYKAKPDPMGYPKRHPRYSHLGKNLELVIDKALNEDDAEKKAGFAHSIAYYMKLAYSNWHKELVHDDAIRGELNKITNGQLEFSNTPYIKHRNQNFVEDDYPARGGAGGRRYQNFGSRNQRDTRNTGGRDTRNNGGNGGQGNRNNNGGRDNRNGGSNNRPASFKKRFK